MMKTDFASEEAFSEDLLRVLQIPSLDEALLLLNQDLLNHGRVIHQVGGKQAQSQPYDLWMLVDSIQISEEKRANRGHRQRIHMLRLALLRSNDLAGAMSLARLRHHQTRCPILPKSLPQIGKNDLSQERFPGGGFVVTY